MKCFLLWAGILLVGCVNTAFSQAYPTKAIRLIVPYPPAGGTDLAARLIGQKLTERFGQTVIVDNRAGANGNIGTDAIAKAAADGYTVGMATPGPVTVGRSLYPSLPYDPARDLLPIILVNESPILLLVHPAVPARSVKELVALAKARPGKLTAALVSLGSVPHLATEMLKASARIDITNVPYKGGAPAATDVVGGQVDMLFSVLPVVLPFLSNGKLRALAIASDKRSALVSAIPTMHEAGYPDVIGTAWNGVVAPAGTPKDVVIKLNAEIAKALEAPDVRERFSALGMEAVGGAPERFATFLRAESTKWSKVIKRANIRTE
jgi:tripartite-type tricarboxylate transporter receptor subunit TctC